LHTTSLFIFKISDRHNVNKNVKRKQTTLRILNLEKNQFRAAAKARNWSGTVLLSTVEQVVTTFLLKAHV